MAEPAQHRNVFVSHRAALSLLLLAACSGGVGGGDGQDPDPQGSGGGSGGGSGAEGGGASACKPSQAPQAPVLRLTAKQYNNTVKDLFAPYAVVVPEQTLIEEATKYGFENNSARQSASALLVERYGASAAAVASLATKDVSRLVGCQFDSTSKAEACGTDFINRFGARAFRRPLTQDEATQYKGFFTKALSDHGFTDAISLVVRAFLQAPAFVYRLELTPPGEALTDFEVAARLSYLVWNSMPDEELHQAASEGRLQKRSDIQAQVERMLSNPKARAAVSDFHRQWLHLDELERLKADAKDTRVFATWNGDVARDLRESTHKFVDWAFWEGDGTLASLLSTPKAFLNRRTAPLYGKTAAHDDLQLVDLDPTQRAGLLTQAGWLAAMAHQKISAPVRRGVFVLDRLLCAPTPAAPPDVDTDVLTTGPGATPKTTREKFEVEHTGSSCRGCHEIIDPIGFAFETYDATGAYRTKENGIDVDARGSLAEVGDVRGEVNGAIELSQKLAESTQPHDCATRQWLAYALARDLEDGDECTVSALTSSLVKGASMKELVVQIATSPTFRGPNGP